MKKTLLAISLAASAHSAFADDPDTRQVFMVRGVGNSTCGQYLEAAQGGGAAFAAYGQWLDGYITARNQTNPKVLDYANAGSAELSAWVATYCKNHLSIKYYEAADRLLSDLVKTGKTKYVK